MDVVPSHLMMQPRTRPGGLDLGFNSLLRPGEVIGIVYPEDSRSLTRKFIEYDVAVEHQENGTSATRVYHNCFLANDLAGIGDHSVRTLRVAEATSGGTRTPTANGSGSKVTLLCLSGSMVQPVIIGGIRDDRDSDRGRKAKGHHLEYAFNGVQLKINDDGSWSVVMAGPTDYFGKLDSSKGQEENGGTTFGVQADGSFEISTGDKKVVIRGDRPGGAITVKAADKVVVDCDTIEIGSGATSQMMMGTEYRAAQSTLNNLMLVALQALQVAAIGPLSGFKPGFLQMIAAINQFETQSTQFLSNHAVVK